MCLHRHSRCTKRWQCQDARWSCSIGRSINALSPYLNEDDDIAQTNRPSFRVPSRTSDKHQTLQ